MTKEQALIFLSQILANIPATKAQHDQFQAALQILIKKD